MKNLCRANSAEKKIRIGHLEEVKFPIPELPLEILNHIGKFCNPMTLSVLAKASPVFSKIFNKDSLWLNFFKNKPTDLHHTVNVKRWVLCVFTVLQGNQEKFVPC